ncbi:MAG: polyphosphate polymerase domain-containing protein [Saprospiraceae bacterium]
MDKRSGQPDFRYEIKYRLEQVGRGVVLQTLQNHPASFRSLFPDRIVNNIYFDTPDLSSYKDNVIGIADRQKLRVRWYGEQKNTVEGAQLEVKIKSNQLGYKKILSMPNFSFEELAPLTKLVNEKSSLLLQPTLVNRYLRSYYGSNDGKFRITIDQELAYFSFYTRQVFDRFTHQEEVLVVELKYAAADEAASEFIKQYLPFRQTKSSKYVNGIQLCLLN